MPVPASLPLRRAHPRAALHYLRRRRLVGSGLLLATRPLQAEGPWPQRPVRIVVGSAPGGGPDIAARLLAQRWQGLLGQPVVVENRVGANGGLAMESVVRAGDGHSLLFGTTGSIAINSALFPAATYDSLRDFAPVGLLSQNAFFFTVAERWGAGGLAGLVAHARTHPGALNFGSPGIGTAQHLAFEQFRHSLGLDIAHVPYRGVAQAFQDLVGGRLDLVIDLYAGAEGAEQTGLARIVAVTSAERALRRPEVPTVAEAAGLTGYEVLAWMALLVPAGTAPSIRAAAQASLAAVLGAGDIAQEFERVGLRPRFLDGAATRDFIEAERARYAAIIRAAGIRPDGG